MNWQKASVFILIAVITMLNILSFSLLGHHGDTCILATSQASDCPMQTTPLQEAVFHVEALQQLTHSQLASSLIFFAGIVANTIMVSYLLLKIFAEQKKTTIFQKQWRYLLPPLLIAQQKIIIWLRRVLGVHEYLNSID